nr:hypothetical protein [Ardenticatena sp.]
MPLSLHRYAFVHANPVNWVDAYGWQACKESSDPECQAKASELKNKALELQEAVRQGEIEPVEAFAQLLEYADTLFNEDPQGVMWGVTNVLLGVDPNKDAVWQVGLGKIDQDANPYYVKQDWLPYRQDPTKGDRHSERGDWKSIYWDETPNQAYHFWYYVAVRYYHGPIMGTLLAHAGNIVHDPFWLEPIFGQDLHKLRESGIPILSQWPDYAKETSLEDFLLALAGIKFGEMMWYMKISPLPRGVNICGGLRIQFFPAPGEWIRAHLKG